MLIREIPCPLPPVEIFTRLSGRAGCFFLDTARPEKGAAGSFSYLGFEPFLTIEAKGNDITLTSVDGTRETRQGDPLTVLRELLAEYRPDSPTPAPFPFTGGAVGGFSYELCAQLDRIPRTGDDDLGLPDLQFGFYDGFFAFGADGQRAWLVANPKDPTKTDGILTRLQQALGEACTGPEIPSRAGSGQQRFVAERGSVSFRPGDEKLPLSATVRDGLHGAVPQPNFTKEAYLRAIGRIKDYIAAGDVYQVNLTQRFAMPQPAPAPELYRRLRTRSPAPYACYFDFGSWQVVGSSPECFLRLRDGRLETRPIKGTRPRGRTPSEDDRLRAELLASEKDCAELLMIVDLERNDLGRVCEFGSIRVDDLYHLEAHPTVFHLDATVTGRLRAGADIFDCLRAAFPGGSITGAPKIRAMQIIDELEPHRRHFYTGSFGYLGFEGSCDLNIAIRTLFCTGGRACYHVGGGIVWDSNPAEEYQETLDKGGAMRAALMNEADALSAKARVLLDGQIVEDPAPPLPPDTTGDGVFETIKVTCGRPVFWAEHCARLTAGIRALGLATTTPPAGLRERCDALIAANGVADGVLQVIVFAAPAADRNATRVSRPPATCDPAPARELITTGPSRYTAGHRSRGLIVRTVCCALRPAGAELKTLRFRALYQHARRTVQAQGADEALFVDEAGTVLEGAVSNLFLVRAGRIKTPPLTSGILPGIVRGLLLPQPILRITEERILATELATADEVFLTNSLMGVMPVARLDGHDYNLQSNPLTRACQAVYRRLEDDDRADPTPRPPVL
ncbi:MAG: aminodeoxychorismate synthase component I [Opitutales bacterium]